MVMRLKLFFFFSVFTCLGLFAQNDKVLLSQADSAYAGGHYRRALEMWEALMSQGKFSADMFYDMSLAAWQTGDAVRTLAYAKRAQRLDPLLKDAYVVEELARNRLDLSSPPREFWLFRWWRIFYTRLSANVWAVFALLWAWLTGLYLLILHRRGKGLLEKGVVWRTLGGLFLMFLSLAASRAQWHVQAVPEELVVLKPASLHVGADADSPPLEELSAGMELRILDRIGNWYKVMTSSGQTGWVEDAVVLAS